MSGDCHDGDCLPSRNTPGRASVEKLLSCEGGCTPRAGTRNAPLLGVQPRAGSKTLFQFLAHFPARCSPHGDCLPSRNKPDRASLEKLLSCEGGCTPRAGTRNAPLLGVQPRAGSKTLFQFLAHFPARCSPHGDCLPSRNKPGRASVEKLLRREGGCTPRSDRRIGVGELSRPSSRTSRRVPWPLGGRDRRDACPTLHTTTPHPTKT